MDAMTLADHMVGHLLWPLIVLFALLSFRAVIREKVPDLRSLKAGAGGIEAEFGRLLDQTIQSMTVESVPTSNGEVTEDRRRLERIAAVSPRAAVLEAFALLDNALKDRLRQIGVPGASLAMRSTQAIMAAQSRALLHPAEVTVWNNLRALSNTVRHQVELDLSVDQAHEYVRIASDLRAAIEQASPQPITPASAANGDPDHPADPNQVANNATA
jgi:hypothetical protein